jgi:hypothetical protein
MRRPEALLPRAAVLRAQRIRSARMTFIAGVPIIVAWRDAGLPAPRRT